jgi:beta-hydroxylase
MVMTASATQNVEGEPIGALNKFFFYFYKVRLAGKKLKQANRTAYYVGKWALIAAVAYALFF